MQRIAVFNTAFLGDAILTLPLIGAVRALYPDAAVDFWVRAGLEPLFSAQPELRRVVPVRKRGKDKGLKGIYKIGMEAAREGYDLWIGAHTSLRSGLIGKCSGAPRRIGYDAPWYNKLLYTDTVSRRFDELAEIERLFELLGPLGGVPQGTGSDMDSWPAMVLPGQARATVAEIWRNNGLDDRPVLGIHPGSTWPTKSWPAEYFGRVADMATDAGVAVLLFAGPGEESLARAVRENAAKAAGSGLLHDLSGGLDLPALAACIDRLDAYVTNDSGPMHLAWYQKTPTVAIFGPTTESLGFFPRGEHATVLEKDMGCRPCGLHGHRQCPEGHHGCMRGVEPEAVWQAVREHMDTRSSASEITGEGA